VSTRIEKLNGAAKSPASESDLEEEEGDYQTLRLTRVDHLSISDQSQKYQLLFLT
jgi:hypothetical protein